MTASPNTCQQCGGLAGVVVPRDKTRTAQVACGPCTARLLKAMQTRLDALETELANLRKPAVEDPR